MSIIEVHRWYWFSCHEARINPSQTGGSIWRRKKINCKNNWVNNLKHRECILFEMTTCKKKDNTFSRSICIWKLFKLYVQIKLISTEWLMVVDLNLRNWTFIKEAIVNFCTKKRRNLNNMQCVQFVSTTGNFEFNLNLQ